MSYELVFTERYLRVAPRFLKRHPELKRPYQKTLALMELDPHHPSLRLHALQGRLDGLHSVSINLSCRITIELRIEGRRIIPVNVGDHDAVYRGESSPCGQPLVNPKPALGVAPPRDGA